MHDRDGRPITEGDLVNVPCVVKSYCGGTDYCNVTVETVEKMFPSEHKSCFSLNSRQVVKSGDCEDAG